MNQGEDMRIQDEWGYDPNVQMMRRIFILLEKSQKALLEVLNISPFDPKLRRARIMGRDLFEQTWPIATQKGIIANENDIALLYQHCLSHALKWNGVKVPNPLLVEGDKIAKFLQEKIG